MDPDGVEAGREVRHLIFYLHFTDGLTFRLDDVQKSLRLYGT